jgi:hypothetical protein
MDIINNRGAQLPFLPGYVPYDQKGGARHQKQSSTCGSMSFMKTDIPTLDLNTLQVMSDPKYRFNMSTRSITHDERAANKESARNTYRPAIAPAWLKHDRQVLRFSAYFQEPVHESPKENFRVRQCVVYFYLEDGTMTVVEPKVENSGIPQGTFVKRHRIPRPKEQGGGHYQPKDLKLGATVVLYCRAFRIVDCDEFTREFYEQAIGADVGLPEDIPLDSFRQGQIESEKAEVTLNRDVQDSKEYAELALGGSRRNQKLQQYLENDGKVLLFSCYWDDPTRYGSRMYYTLHYYLSDDSVEVLENLPRNSGRDPYPVFWRRAPLRKNPHVSPAPGMMEPDPINYKPEDFNVGETIQLYGRSVFLYDCDDFTREFFKRYTGVVQPKITVSDPKPVHVKLTYPPHTGFGTDEDSMGSCLHLTPRAPRRDINKLMGDQGKVLRFQGQMMNGKMEDQNRRFVVAIYLADDSVGVWELRQRNSGHTEGKFAEKSKKKNPATGTWFTPTDFQIGGVVEVNSTPFRLLRGDAATLSYMEKYCQYFPMADLRLIGNKLIGLQDDFAVRGDTMTPDDVSKLAEEKLGVTLDPHEMVTLRRACGEMQERLDDTPDDAFDAAEAPADMVTAKLMQLLDVVSGGQ